MITLQEQMSHKGRVTKIFFDIKKKKKTAGEASGREFQERSGQQVKQVGAAITTPRGHCAAPCAV